MTSTEPASPPADPARYRRKGLGVGFWLLIIFGFGCIGLGVFVAKYVPALTARKDPAPAATVEPWRKSSTEPVTTVVTPAAAPAVAVPAAPAGDYSALSARIAELEAGQTRTLQAASSALAASALFQAAQTSRPFAAELSAVEPLMGASPDLASLRRIAATGAPTRASLSAEFPAAASRAIAASRRPDSRASLFDRVRHALGSVITIRRIDVTEGKSAHAVLARAEVKVSEGDVEGALTELDTLPPAARDALGTWRVRAEQRAEVDRRVAALRETAVRALRETGTAS